MGFDEFAEAIANDLKNVLVQTAPTDKGTLRLSIDVVYEPLTEELVVSMADHWKYVEFGTNPHIILPKDKKALAWGKNIGAGKKEFVAKKVMHPGTRPQPFLRSALFKDLREIVEMNAEKYLSGEEMEVYIDAEVMS